MTVLNSCTWPIECVTLCLPVNNRHGKYWRTTQSLIGKYLCKPEDNTMSSYTKLTIDLEVGQTILVGKNKEPAKITKIEFFEKSGEISLGTTKGKRKAMTFSLPCSDAA